jgi:transposase-like protein/IS1 family transposase
MRPKVAVSCDTQSLYARAVKGQVTCPDCKSDSKKFGFFGPLRIQRFRCKSCKKTFAAIPDRPMDSLRIPTDKAVQVIHLLCEGVGVRAIERLTGIHRDRVLSVLEVAGRKCATLLDTKLRGLEAEQIGVDELYGFVNCKQYHCPQNDELRGDQYTWLSMERTTKLIINWHVGKRTAENCFTFMEDLKRRIASRFQLSTDGYAGYTGYNGAVIQTFGNQIDYGFEVKHYGSGPVQGERRYSPMVCQWSKRVAQVGNPDMSMVNTSHVERANLSFRLFNRRLTRLTLGYSKKIANLRLSLALFIAHYNFCRVHSAHKQTPAMAHGITGHVWSIEELLTNRPAERSLSA